MGTVHELHPQREHEPSPAALLADLQTKEEEGSLRSFMHFAESTHGSLSFGVTGGFAERLQLASYALAQALTNINDRIMAAGAGSTRSSGISHKLARRPLPRDLKGTR